MKAFLEQGGADWIENLYFNKPTGRPVAAGFITQMNVRIVLFSVVGTLIYSVLDSLLKFSLDICSPVYYLNDIIENESQ